MSDKHLTISNRWRDWAKIEPIWAYSALSSMALAFVSLIVHLWLLAGFFRGFCLITMIVFASITELILLLRKQWWWFTFWTYVILGVGAWEIASYFFGGV